MGKGDNKSRRGKIILGTSGVKRNRKKKSKILANKNRLHFV
ncbi:30S ribosomal protein THX [Flavobacteriaceae bacterium]|nr:30S ribosomal protein THX [Flavobacteriaceae bacterium]MDC1460749.1 30S ribosomal protein THX [Flavobacteriaceae bacterium]